MTTPGSRTQTPPDPTASLDGGTYDREVTRLDALIVTLEQELAVVRSALAALAELGAHNRVVRFPGIVADAQALGVNRVTLYRVLTGEFTHLKGLSKRYDALKAKQKKGGAK